MEIASRMDDVPSSGTLEILSLANKLEEEGKDIIHLGVGQPDFDTPPHIKKSAKDALERGETGYTNSAGIRELREAISKSLKKKEIDRNRDGILVTPGAKHSLFSSMATVLDPKDEIIIPSPCWTYEGMTRILNIRPVFVEAPEENEFILNPEDVKEKISSKTKTILLNYPNNPTGVMLDEESLRALGDLASDHDLWILTDEVYDELIYEKAPPSISSFPEYEDRTIYINSFSKTYAMTGWRLGYTAAPKEVISEMIKIQQNSTTCPTAFAQRGGTAALNGPQDCVKEMVSEYRKRKNVIVKGLNSIEGLSCVEPQGAFYVFPNIEELGMKSEDFCKYLIEKAGVATTPGSVFGPAGEDHIRISYANSLEKIEKALERIERAISSMDN